MSLLITYLLVLLFVAYVIIIFVEFYKIRSLNSFLIQAGIFVIVIFLLNKAFGFPVPRYFFGGISPITTIIIMFVFVIIGMSANFYFFKKEDFCLRSFLKPFVISPIIVLPLFELIRGTPNIQMIQLVYFSFFSFQNCFFWRDIFDRDKTKM